MNKGKGGYELTGELIQGYKISKPIGQGKFSIVYRAENEQGIPFALKKINIFDMADQREREKCLREVQLMKPLNHPNIIKYVGSFIHNNQLIIVTEWAEKGDLKKLIKEHEADELPFEERVIWEYMRQIASALKHMHQKRIMHRDLKPANIFISADGTLKVGDLGLGRLFSDKTFEAYSKVGTPLYMSPQLIQDFGYNENADVWSLGCICYELAELKSPFRNQGEKMNMMQLFQNITKCRYHPISSNYSPQLSKTIDRMIVVNPAKRCSSEDVLNEANKFLESSKKTMLDSFITMDDIQLKLVLLEYEVGFCKVAERKPVNKLYFAIEDKACPVNDQLYYFLELTYWLMTLSKPDRRKQKLAIYSKTLIDWRSPQDACVKLLADIASFGKGYGEAVCYILNEVLTRELIRNNFQFLKPIDTENSHDFERAEYIVQPTDSPELDDETNKLQESLEEQSQFEQSIFFNKQTRKEKNLPGGLLEKIEELDNEENRQIIEGRVDEREWRAECLRLEKQFTEISGLAKETRRRNGYSNIETAKICSSKLTDLLKFVQPATSTIYRTISHDLQLIKKGEGHINAQFSHIGESYSQKNLFAANLQNKSQMLSSWLRDNIILLEKTEQRIAQFEQKTRLLTTETENSPIGKIKQAVIQLQQQVVDLQQRKEILGCQLRQQQQHQKTRGKEEYLDMSADYLLR